MGDRDREQRFADVLAAESKESSRSGTGAPVGTKEGIAMELHQIQIRAAVARAICAACGEQPEHPGDARGNAFRWQDYEPSAEVVLLELRAAEAGEPGRSAVPHLAEVIAQCLEDGPDSAWQYERAAGDAVRAYVAH